MTHKSPQQRPLRFVSAASLFDGHDAAINMIRRLLQAHGAEVVHLGHNRSVADIVRAAIQEDADAIAVSSYQGGHNEYFRYMVDMLREQGVTHIRVIVGGGGTIAPDEIAALEQYGIEKIYTPEDGRRLGLDGMIADVFARVRAARRPAYAFAAPNARDHRQLAATISELESARRRRRRCGAGRRHPPGHRRRAAAHAGDRPHRHRRRRQVQPQRRAAAALRAPLPRTPDRRRGDGSDAPALRRRAARRSHPHERARLARHLHALAGDAAAEPRDQRRARRRGRPAAARRLRPHHRRDRRHRAVGHRDRRSRATCRCT